MATKKTEPEVETEFLGAASPILEEYGAESRALGIPEPEKPAPSAEPVNEEHGAEAVIVANR